MLGMINFNDMFEYLHFLTFILAKVKLKRNFDRLRFFSYSVSGGYLSYSKCFFFTGVFELMHEPIIYILLYYNKCFFLLKFDF